MSRRSFLICAFAAAVGLAAGFWIASNRSARPEQVKAAFHRLYHQRGESTYNSTYWLGAQAQKCPLDMWSFQEILYETKPDVLVEMGTFKGGSAYFFASIFDLLKHGRVVTVDIEDFKGKPAARKDHLPARLLDLGEIVAKVRSSIAPGERVMVVLDSDHHRDHVLKSCGSTAGWCPRAAIWLSRTPTSTGTPSCPNSARAPWEAVEEFLGVEPGLCPGP